MGCCDCWALLDVLVRCIYPYLLLVVGLVRRVVGLLCKGRRKSVGYEEKKAAVVKEVLYNRRQGSPLAIGGKTTTNLFRFRSQPAAFRINVGHFTEVLEVNEKQLYCVAEGMTTFEGLVEETLKKGVMPAVVPELKSITIGGAISGVGVESTSFRYGFVHEMVEEMEVLLADGRTVVCSASNEHSDLFYGMANSYGSLGYILKVKFRCIPVKKYVQLRYFRYNDATKLFRDMKTYCEQPDTDFVDGVMFDKDELYLILGTFVDTAPFVSDYKHMNVFWQSIPQRNTDYLTVKDYIWRWDTDWFWCSRYFYMNNPLVRAMFGLAGKLRSVTYMWIWRTYINMGLYRQPREFVIQDVEIPLKNCTQFLEFFHDEIGIKPVWMCPVRSYLQKCKYPLYLIDPSTLYVNFGFWDTVEVKSGQKDKTNIALEHKVAELSGKKSLYSSVHYTEDDFWKNYNKEEYLRLKSKYDSNSYLLGLYEKTAGKK